MGLVNNEQEGIRKKAGVAQFKVQLQLLPEASEEDHQHSQSE